MLICCFGFVFIFCMLNMCTSQAEEARGVHLVGHALWLHIYRVLGWHWCLNPVLLLEYVLGKHSMTTLAKAVQQFPSFSHQHSDENPYVFLLSSSFILYRRQSSVYQRTVTCRVKRYSKLCLGNLFRLSVCLSAGMGPK